ncbi:DNA polymerase III subunit delta' [Desulfoglaeba alkanexedens]|nr:DNA polymerase III subunit delta' [Desulfoglaeba alkanexedens]
MSFESVPGQPRAKRFLQRLVMNGTIPHALLLTGMKGIGKRALAEAFAKLLNCLAPSPAGACDRCASCTKIEKGLHPDILRVVRDGAFIKLDQVRDLRERLRFMPSEGRFRVVVLEDAQDLKEEASNALLKILEEPPAQNVFILMALEPQMLLPTIVSRCCHVRCQPLDEDWIARHLAATYRIGDDQARKIARLSFGSLDRAAWWVEADRMDRLRQVLERIARLKAASVLDVFSMAAAWSKESEDLEQDMECIKFWLREKIMVGLEGSGDPEIFAAASAEATGRLSIEALLELYQAIEETARRLRQHANRQLALEGAGLKIRDLLNGKSCRYTLSKWGQSLSF